MTEVRTMGISCAPPGDHRIGCAAADPAVAHPLYRAWVADEIAASRSHIPQSAVDGDPSLNHHAHRMTVIDRF